MVRKKRLIPVTLMTAAALTLSACSTDTAESASSSDEGFEYGAPQEEVQELVADLEPVTLTYQPNAGSPNSVMAQYAKDFKESVEERSGGQITIDIVWGQGIAGYSELFDALADGRVDIASTVPIYEPDEFPIFNALGTVLGGLPTSPVEGEAIFAAVASELGAQTEGLHEEFEAQGVVPIAPLISSGAYYSLCSSEDTSVSDWAGNQVRVATADQREIKSDIGATPVSMEFVEAYEALQRGTVDCNMGQLHSAYEVGVLEVAPFIMHPTDTNAFPGRTAVAEIAGPGFESLPMAYQQIIFDSMWVARSAGKLSSIIDGKEEAVSQAKSSGGGVFPFDSDLDQMIGESNERLSNTVQEAGVVSTDLVDSIPELMEKWQSKVEEMGYKDEGTMENLDQWWEQGEVDFTDLTEQIYIETGLQHRPN